MIVDLANAGAVVVCSAGNNSFAVDSPNNVMSLYDVGYNYYYNGETMTYTKKYITSIQLYISIRWHKC